MMHSYSAAISVLTLALIFTQLHHWRYSWRWYGNKTSCYEMLKCEVIPLEMRVTRSKPEMSERAILWKHWHYRGNRFCATMGTMGM